MIQYWMSLLGDLKLTSNTMDDINAKLIATVMEKNQEDTLGAETDIYS